MTAGWLGDAYLWVKAAHVIFVIFWMAGLLMLPRFFVYHHATVPGSTEDGLWIARENRLRRIILSPGIVVVWSLGIALALNLGIADGTPGLAWLHAKIALVFLLSGYHGYMIGYGRKLARGLRPGSEKALRLLNEVPSLATIAIVILVIVRPF